MSDKLWSVTVMKNQTPFWLLFRVVPRTTESCNVYETRHKDRDNPQQNWSWDEVFLRGMQVYLFFDVSLSLDFFRKQEEPYPFYVTTQSSSYFEDVDHYVLN